MSRFPCIQHGRVNHQGDHNKNHAKTWNCDERKGSQLGSREHKPKLRKSHAERGTERTEGLRGRFAEARQRNTARPRGTWYGVTTGTHAQHNHVASETGNKARGRRGSSIWQREPVVESRRQLREGGWELKCEALDPKKAPKPYAIERQEGDRTGYASEGDAPRHKKTEEYTRRTAGDDQSQTGERKQERLKEKTYVILGTMSHRGSHAQVQRLN